MTRLHQAAIDGDLVRDLLLEGAKVNTTDEFGKTHLHYAVENGSIEIVKLLLEREAFA